MGSGAVAIAALVLITGIVPSTLAGAGEPSTQLPPLAGGWIEETKLHPAEHPQASVGDALAVGSDVVAVGAPGIDSVFLYERVDGELERVATLEGGAGFGSDLAAGGPWIFVTDPASGSVAVYAEAGDGWERVEDLEGSSGSFGWAIDASADGDTVAVSARGEQTDVKGGGAVYVLDRRGDTWESTTRLVPSETERWGSFGYDVSLGPSGQTLTVGTLYEDGAAFVFDRGADGWSEVAAVSNADPWAGFGRTTAAAEDVAFVGAPGASSSGLAVGAVYVFEDTGEGTWEQTQVLEPDDAAPVEDSGSVEFGRALDVREDRLLVGAPTDDVSPGVGFPLPQNDEACYEAGWLLPACDRPGAAYLFERAEGAWVQTAKVAPDDTSLVGDGSLDLGYGFGASVAIDPATPSLLAGAVDGGPVLEERSGYVSVYNSIETWIGGEDA